MDLGLQGKVALVTGASKGLGRGIAAELVAEGARVAISSHSRERIEATGAELGVPAFVHDTGDLDDAARLVADVEDQLGPLDILVCNTGGPPGGPDALGFTRDQWRQAYDSLVVGPMALIEATMPGMRERGFGRIVNVASAGVREPIPNLMLSNAHRVSMINAFKTLARQVAADGVTLNSVLPGRIDTDRIIELVGSREAAEAAARDQIPARRLGTVEEFAAVATFLCSPRASYVTGETVVVDGGMTQSVF
jgi:3-oxoacyl-[acyl-carrier protein] reductase